MQICFNLDITWLIRLITVRRGAGGGGGGEGD